MTYRNPLYGCQHPFPNSAASVNIKLLLNIISPSFGPRTHELLPCGYKWRKVAKLFRKAKPKLTIEVQPSPKVPLRPHNSTCKVKSPPSHIIMMLPRRGTSCWFAISDGHHVSSNYAVAPVGICLQGSPRNCPRAVISGLQRASTFERRSTFSIGSPTESCRSRALRNDAHSSSSIT